MDLFNEIDDLNDLFLLEKNTKLSSAAEEYEDLQSKYSSLHESYAKEMENSKKVEKCLSKCLKFYSKLCKKYEVQQKIISSLEENIKEKINSLEEAQKNEERMKGLIEVYRTERSFYSGQTNSELKKDKEVLLNICCKLITEPLKNQNIRNIINLLLRKFKNDLDDEMVNVLKGKNIKLKDEVDFSAYEDLKSDFSFLKSEIKFKVEDKCNNEVTKVEEKESEEDTMDDPLDLSISKLETEDSSCSHSRDSSQNEGLTSPKETELHKSDVPLSLPPLEEFSASLMPPDENSVAKEKDLDQRKYLEMNNSSLISTHLENIPKSPSSRKYEAPTVPLKSPSTIPAQSNPEKLLNQPKSSRSIFDISDVCLNTNTNNNNNIEVQTEQQRTVDEKSEDFLDVFFETENESNHRTQVVNNSNNTNSNLVNSEEQTTFPYEKELIKIFREMSSMRLLSPVRECTNSLINIKTSSVVLNVNKSVGFEKSQFGTKRNSEADEKSGQSKKLKSEEEEEEIEKAPKCNLLDSIMSAMSIQNEEFKSKGVSVKKLETNTETAQKCPYTELGKTIYRRNKKPEKGISKENALLVDRGPRKVENGKQSADRQLVTDEIKNFVSSPISCKEDADRNVKRCLSVLSNKSEDLIAKCTVAVVLENVDEAVEILERPSPPLTKTQHRLIVLLSVFRTLDLNFESVSTKILSIIWEKLFPDNFFWPDDSVEAATRFYAALCRVRNDPKTLWKFCLQAMTDMRQRCPLLMFTVLKTWPDILHDASTLKNNVLTLTIVNIFLHMPKKEGLRNLNQGKKLIALKHLLMNFYQFKIEDSIENYAKKVFDAVCSDEVGSKKSLVLLFKCRDKSWTIKNLLPMIKSRLVDWLEGGVDDSVGIRILSVMKQIFPILEDDIGQAKVKETVSCLSEILTSATKSHDCEVNVVEVLLQLKQFPEVRKAIREWIPKEPISDNLRNEIINVSADSILRELKMNRKKEGKNNSPRKLKKHARKSKVKKKKGKKSKKNSKVGQNGS